MNLASILRTIARVHRYMSGNEIYDHGVMRSLKGNLRTDGSAITASKLVAKILRNAPKTAVKAVSRRRNTKG